MNSFASDNDDVDGRVFRTSARLRRKVKLVKRADGHSERVLPKDLGADP